MPAASRLKTSSVSASTAGAVKPGVAVSAPVSVTSGPPVFIARHTAPSAKVDSDEARSYLGLSGFDHEAVNHGVSKYVMAHTQGIESFWAMLKRAHAGTYHKISRLCCKPDVGVSQIRTTTVLSSCFCVGQTVL